MSPEQTKGGIVAIGRNEGERLLRCIASAMRTGHPVVYVDSGSTDGSVEAARKLGAEVVILPSDGGFTAARARNAGYRRLREVHPDMEWVFFVDGDCELRDGFVEAASHFLAAHPRTGIVCGRRRERHPDRSPYNRLADMEWNTPIGEADACGGDAMIRVAAFDAAGGYDPSLIAGEDPELCLRVRRAGYTIMRLDLEMTWHDAAMFRSSQWWRRTVRTGHAYAESVYLHGRGPEHYRVRQLRSALLWGAALPAGALAFAPPSLGLSAWALAGSYGLLFERVRRIRRARGESASDAALYAAGCVIGKIPLALGAGQFAWNRWVRKRRSTLIEYKGAGEDAARSARASAA